MRNQKALITMLQGLVKLLSAEAERNPKFADELDALLSPLPTGKPRRKQQNQGLPLESLPDIHTEYSTKGEFGFRLWLRDQPIEILRSLIRAHDFDARRRTAKWKNTEQLCEFITEQLRARLARGSGFLLSGDRPLAPDKREAIRRKLGIDRILAVHPQLTVWLTNRSDSSVWVKSLSLWHGQKRLNRARPSDNRASVEVAPNREKVGIAFVSDDDAMLKLQSLRLVDKHLPGYEFSDALDIEVHFDYDALGIEDEFRETVRVRVHGNRQIESL